MLVDCGQRRLWVEAVLQHDRGAEGGADHVLPDAPGVEERRDDEVLLAHAVRHPSEQPADRI